MNRTAATVLGLALATFAIGCEEPPSLQPEPVEKASSTLATYEAGKTTKSKFGIVKWQLRHAGDGEVLEGLDRTGKSVSHLSLALRKAEKEPAAMVWYGDEVATRGFVKGNSRGMAAAAVPDSLPEWAEAAAFDLDRFAEEGRTPYGCADELFGVFGNFLKSTAKPECAKTDSMQGCISKLMQDQPGPVQQMGGIGGILGTAAKLLGSCKPAPSGTSTGTTSTSTGTTTTPSNPLTDIFKLFGGATGGTTNTTTPPSGTAVKEDPAVNSAIGNVDTQDPFGMGNIFNALGSFF